MLLSAIYVKYIMLIYHIFTLSFLAKVPHVSRHSCLVPFRATGHSCPRRQSLALHGEALILLLFPSPGREVTTVPTALICMDAGSVLQLGMLEVITKASSNTVYILSCKEICSAYQPVVLCVTAVFLSSSVFCQLERCCFQRVVVGITWLWTSPYVQFAHLKGSGIHFKNKTLSSTLVFLKGLVDSLGITRAWSINNITDCAVLG